MGCTNEAQEKQVKQHTGSSLENKVSGKKTGKPWGKNVQQRQTEERKERCGPLKKANCAAEINTGYYYEAALYLWCSCILLKHRRWGMMWRRSQGRYLGPVTGITVTWTLSKNQTCFMLSPEKLHVLISASEQSLENHLLFHGSQRWLTWDEQTRAVSRFRSPPSLPLNIPNSAQTDTHGEQYLVPPTKCCVMLNPHPLLNSKPQQQHWEFRRLLHNCGVSATQHSHQFLKVGTSAIQKGKKKSEFLPRANIRSRR